MFYAGRTANGPIPALIFALVFAGAWAPAATHAQGESAVAHAPEKRSSGDDLREIVVVAPRLMETVNVSNVSIERNSRLEEVTVRGRRSLTAYRLEAVAARERVWEVFNEINSDDRLDISCWRRSRTGTRIPKRVCRPRYADHATSEAAKSLIRRVQLSCPPPPPVDPACLEAAYAAGMAEAQRYIGEIAHMDNRLDEEAQRLARENPQFAIAILEYQDKQREYQEARRRR